MGFSNPSQRFNHEVQFSTTPGTPPPSPLIIHLIHINHNGLYLHDPIDDIESISMTS